MSITQGLDITLKGQSVCGGGGGGGGEISLFTSLNSFVIVHMFHLCNRFRSNPNPTPPQSFDKLDHSSVPSTLQRDEALWDLIRNQRPLRFIVFHFVPEFFSLISERAESALSGFFLLGGGGCQPALCLIFHSRLKNSVCVFLWDAASVLPGEIILYWSSICLRLPQTCKLISVDGFSGPGAHFLFILRGGGGGGQNKEANNVTHTIRASLLSHENVFVISLDLAAGKKASSPREAGYQVLLFQLVVPSAAETRKRF